MPTNLGPIRPTLPFEVIREGVQEPPLFNRFERRVVENITTHVQDPNTGPILTQGERELVIESPDDYFDHFLRVEDPRATVALVRSGESSTTEEARKRRAKRAIVRGRKSDMFAENVMTATHANDVCRSMYRFMVTGEFTPVGDAESPYQAMLQAGDYVTDLLEGARSSEVVRSSAMPRTIDTIRAKFDSSPSVATALIVLSGFNTAKKVNLWLDQLFVVSHGLERVSKGVKADLVAYAQNRAPEHKAKLDLEQAIADKLK